MKKILALILLLVVCVSMIACTEYKTGTREIKGLKLSENMTTDSSGVFFLGVGVYESDSEINTDYYTYIKGVEGFRLQVIKSDYLEIVETNDIKPCIKGTFHYDGSIIYGYNYIIYVPEGTIYEEYSADLVK